MRLVRSGALVLATRLVDRLAQADPEPDHSACRLLALCRLFPLLYIPLGTTTLLSTGSFATVGRLAKSALVK